MSFGTSKLMVQGIIGGFLRMGVSVEKLDLDNEILYLKIPEKSYDYNDSQTVKCAQDLACRIKETWIGLGIFSKNCTVKYKTYDVYWTKEMGEKNYQENKYKVTNLML